MGARINYSGLVVAAIGFFLTRFTVTLSLYEEPIHFLLAGIVPLTLGLGLAAFGVALAVANIDPVTVRTTASWCVVGLGTMLVLGVLTLLGSGTGEAPALATIESRGHLSNYLIGGASGGALTGLYAARTRRHQHELEHHANRLEVLNRLLRHEVLNAVTVIRGYATGLTDHDTDAIETIKHHADTIEDTIAEVRFLARDAGPRSIDTSAVDCNACLAASVDTVAAEHPDAEISFQPHPDDPTVRANERLTVVFTHLLENAIVHTTERIPTVTIVTTVSATEVRVSITDDGPGLPDRQRSLLETGEIARYDDTSSGFGLNIVRLLVESYAGEIETDTTEHGSTVTVALPRAGTDEIAHLRYTRGIAEVPLALPHLLVTLAAALVAGVCYGFVSELLGGSIAGIGVFYGAVSPVVGWITHEFHSVVFGFVFAGILSITPGRYRTAVPAHILLGLGWALVLWIGAAGVIAPVWLRLLGIPADIPSLSVPVFVAHVVWGVTLGLLTAVGHRYVSPLLAPIVELAYGRRD